MVTTHTLGFPRIGAQRELKSALEQYWRGDIAADALQDTAARLRRDNWQHQSDLDFVAVGDFSLYDHVLDASVMFGNVPARARGLDETPLDTYFRVARGKSVATAATCGHQADTAAGEMTKYLDTNYHYIVPEFSTTTDFSLDASTLIAQIREARSQGVRAKPVIIGPVSYLWLGKATDGSDRVALLARLLPHYQALLRLLAQEGIDWVQIDEPILVTEMNEQWQRAMAAAYATLQGCQVRLLLTTYFGQLHDNLALACTLPVDGLHLDAINARADIAQAIESLATHQVLSLGIIDGRNIWKTDLHATLEWLEPIHRQLQDRLWIAPSCSLMHVPVDLAREVLLEPEIASWLAFSVQKLGELRLLGRALNHGRVAVQAELVANHAAVESRRRSTRVHDVQTQAAVARLDASSGQRAGTYAARVAPQAARLKLPPYPTTSIGSFPQTAQIREARRRFRAGEIGQADYDASMREEIAACVEEQEALGLDVFVHGEPERNDMVEYFGERLDGYAFSQFGWVQSYGSRCVKPPILYGDIRRPGAMTVEWTRYAQSLTDKPMKGMLTGPVTMLNWSFVRDDQPRSTTCFQLALAIREEVLDLEQAGVAIIQIDEAALREGLPLHKSKWPAYLAWTVEAFRIAANGVRDTTQIHTHMCYSQFNDIIESIARMDADVITIETSRSDMALLDAFDDFAYPNQIGPGVYDIHSPNIPTADAIVSLMQKAAMRIPADRLWVNPDCGLKTRNWTEVRPALANMVAAARTLRGAL